MKKPGYFVYQEFLRHGQTKPARPILIRTQWPNRREYMRSRMADKLSLWEFDHRQITFNEEDVNGEATWEFKKRPWDFVIDLLYKITGRPHRDIDYPQVTIELTRDQASVSWGYEDWDKIDAERAEQDR